MSVIRSLLDNDLYTFTVMQMVYHQFPGVSVEYALKNRGIENLSVLKDEIEKELVSFCSLSFTKEELDYLRTIRYLKSDFIDFLSLFKPQLKHVKVYEENNELVIKVTGPWVMTVIFEVPILAIINELWSKKNEIPVSSYTTETFTAAKLMIAKINNFTFSDFGTRRRHSFSRQASVVNILSKQKDVCVGTSNVLLAKNFNMTPIGTMSHQIFMAAQQLGPRIVDSQKFMLQTWVNEYRGDLGIALTDTIGIDAFLKDFDLYFAKLYDGLRHDSGDPFSFGYKVIDHYKKLRIDPMTKKLVFSDSLNFQKAVSIAHEFSGKIPVTFGIGTNLTNDSRYGHPLNIVMKLTSCSGQPVTKISDSEGKSMCYDAEYEAYVHKVFGK